MKRLEAVIAWAVAFFMVSAGLTWKFGSYGLGGAGIALLIALCFIDVKE